MAIINCINLGSIHSSHYKIVQTPQTIQTKTNRVTGQVPEELWGPTDTLESPRRGESHDSTLQYDGCQPAAGPRSGPSPASSPTSPTCLIHLIHSPNPSTARQASTFSQLSPNHNPRRNPNPTSTPCPCRRLPCSWPASRDSVGEMNMLR